MQSPVLSSPRGPENVLRRASKPINRKMRRRKRTTVRVLPQSHNSTEALMNKRRSLVPNPGLGQVRLCLTALALAPYAVLRQSAGRPPFENGGKSGLHTDTAPDNVRRGRPQGKRHRKQTAGSLAARPSSGKARVKGCGKSAPRGRQRQRHGKPRREQNRIGATRGATSAARPCPLALPLGLVA